VIAVSQRKAVIRRKAGDDEFLGPQVEIALTERRRIDRVEELSQLFDANLYDLALLRECVPSGRRVRLTV
jgi:hypothetical protein